MSSPREINYCRHDYSSRQALSILLECWKADRYAPVILIDSYMKTTERIKQIRVALSKERNNQNSTVHYGFATQRPFPWTDPALKGERLEALIIAFRVTPLQGLRNSFPALSASPIK